jgi:hypothetical protein
MDNLMDCVFVRREMSDIARSSLYSMRSAPRIHLTNICVKECVGVRVFYLAGAPGWRGLGRMEISYQRWRTSEARPNDKIVVRSS